MYEDQVPTPAQSPVYREAYYQTAANLLRHQEVRLDHDILSSELHDALARGEGVPLMQRKEQLYNLSLPSGSPVVGREVRSLGLAIMGALIVGVIRGESEIVPHGGTRLRVGDGLLVVAEGDAIEGFRALIAPSKPSKEKAPR